MKTYVKSNKYSDIPTLEIEVTIYGFHLIRAAYLPEVIDKNGNIIDSEEYQRYQSFISDVEKYLNTLNIRMCGDAGHSDSASEYFSFVVLDENGNDVFQVKCIIRISDHMPKRYRGKKVIDVIVEHKAGRHDKQVVSEYLFTTTKFTAYKACLKRIKDEIDRYYDIVISGNATDLLDF